MNHYSHSMLGTFEQCPLKFKFQYVEKRAKELGEGIEAFMGSRVHETLEQTYLDAAMGKIMSLQEALAFYQEAWDKNDSEDIRIVKKRYTKEDYRNVGKKCLEQYYARYAPFQTDKTIGTEIQVSIKLGEHGKYKVIGYIDRLADNGAGHYAIHDYKTSSSLPAQEHFEEDRQLALYAIAVHEMYPDAKQVELIWHYLVFDKDMRSSRTMEQLGKLKHEIVESIEHVEKAVEREAFPAKPSTLCNWCDFQQICPMQKHVYATSALTADRFKNDSGVQLVDKLAHYKSMEKEFLGKVQPEIEALEAALMAFAEKENVKVIAGSDAQAKVYERSTPVFPEKDSKEEEKMIALLDKEGKRGVFLALDKHAVAHALKEQEFSKETTHALEKLIHEKQSAYVRILRKEE